MSKQLAVSSAFATFAMAAMALIHTPDRSGHGTESGVFAVEAELPQIELPGPSILPG
ncbi:hypothetical protein [Altererythrobacter xiamenensis]|nr:hypothetical protein [Altererythrobacter xiamenensis]